MSELNDEKYNYNREKIRITIILIMKSALSLLSISLTLSLSLSPAVYALTDPRRDSGLTGEAQRVFSDLKPPSRGYKKRKL